MTAFAPVSFASASTRCTRPEMSYSPLTTIGPSMGRVASLTRSVPSLIELGEPEAQRVARGDEVGGRLLDREQDGLGARAGHGAPRLAGRGSVLPVPLLPATSVERPSGMPPFVMMSRPGTVVSIFLRSWRSGSMPHM
jgi:hypothetical protein